MGNEKKNRGFVIAVWRWRGKMNELILHSLATRLIAVRSIQPHIERGTARTPSHYVCGLGN